MNIGFLACAATLPGSPVRRKDAYEHDRQVSALTPALTDLGHELRVMDWRAPMAEFAGMPLVLVGTPWDYQDNLAEFLAKIDALEATGIMLCNSPETVRWNIDKRYLGALADLGARTIPTLWVEHPTAADIEHAFAQFGSDRVVVKRQVGAGAEGQQIFGRGESIAPDWSMDRPAMIQPFQHAIASEGEYSFVFIDGQLSHALLKSAANGDYRIQSIYGGSNRAIEPAKADVASAATILDLLPLDPPLYARIDMVRGDEGQLLLMEAELIEPYLYPEEGPNLGPRLAQAINRRLG
ncbi:MAG: hypothetical protein C0510_03195 [Erythrobacter sp.]|nr:hypothetical protein [Erythrobacter sp.]